MIWKYPLDGTQIDLQMPVGTRILHVSEQHGGPTFWALVDTDASLEMRSFRLYATGEPMANPVQYVGTVLLSGGAYVFHLFEITAPSSTRAPRVST